MNLNMEFIGMLIVFAVGWNIAIRLTMFIWGTQKLNEIEVDDDGNIKQSPKNLKKIFWANYLMNRNK